VNAFLTQLLVGGGLLLLQGTFFAELFRQLFGDSVLAALRFNFLFLISLYFGFFRDFGEGLASAFLLGVLAGILYPYLFSFYPSYAVAAFLAGWLLSQIFLVRQSRLLWVLVLAISLGVDAGLLYLLPGTGRSLPQLLRRWPELGGQAALNVLLFPAVKALYHRLHYYFYSSDPQRALDEITFARF
jgi:hypothetical protein